MEVTGSNPVSTTKEMSKKINITLPDGTVLNKTAGITGLEIAEEISSGLAKVSMLVELNGQLCDLSYPINEDSEIKILKKDSEEALELIRHDCAHVMAEAVQELYPGTQVTIGPAIENGFYYDFSRETPFALEDLSKIEKKMHQIIDRGNPFVREVWDRQDAIKHFSKIGEIYKSEIISDLPEDEEITVYRQGDWVDLCRGPHLPTTRHIGKSFKLMKVAGAYWRGDEKNEMLTRIYGTAWRNDKELNAYLKLLEDAEKRDHRKIGKELEIFAFDEEIGPGLPLWLPNGGIMIEELENLAKETENKSGYFRVKTPHLTKGDLYERSGHLDHYKESMFPAMNIDGIDYYVKPMNCPHHHKIFAASPKSYRDLPYRLAEYGTCYRYEKSGQLFGLMRVRSMQMNDAHIYCTEEQFKDEFIKVCNMYLHYFKIFNIEKYEMRLSLHSKEGLGKKYFNEPELWKKTENSVREALNEAKLNFVEVEGEAAFYGPKIDVQVWSAIGREFTLATNQVDFVVPRQFDLNYIDENNQKKVPLCIHRAPLSTHERFVGFLIEHFGGDFPLWLAPKQVVILPVSQKHYNYANEIKDLYCENGIRAEVDIRNEKIGAKIRQAELLKIPLMLIVGDKEKENNSVSLRRRLKGDLGKLEYNKLMLDVLDEINKRSI